MPVVCLLVKAHAEVAMGCLEEAGGEGMLLRPLVAMPLLAGLWVLHLWEFAGVLGAADGGVIFRMHCLWKLVRNPIASACLVNFPGAKPHDVWEPAVSNLVWLYKIGVQYVCPQHHYNYRLYAERLCSFTCLKLRYRMEGYTHHENAHTVTQGL